MNASSCPASRASNLGYRGKQQGGQGEVSEVVGAELQLEAIFGLAPGRHHHAGVVDQQVDPVGEPVSGGGCEIPDRGKARQVEPDRVDFGSRGIGPNPIERFAGPVHVPTGHQHGRTGAGQIGRDFEAEAAVGPGDHGRSAALVGDLLRCPAHRS